MGVIAVQPVSTAGKIIEMFPNKQNKNNRQYTNMTSHGKTKASEADPIMSLDDIRAIQSFYLSQDRVRDYMMFTVGVCLGFRISDLCQLKIRDIFNDDMSYKKAIQIYERKTGKLSSNTSDKCIITEAMKIAIDKYISSETRTINMDDYLIWSRKPRKTGEHVITGERGWAILKEAQRALDLPYNIGSHTMRKTFSNIAMVVCKSQGVDQNALSTVQHLLKHSDYKTTMRYLKIDAIFSEQAREGVSDFVLGKTEYNNLADALYERSDRDGEMSHIVDLLNQLIEMSGD